MAVVKPFSAIRPQAVKAAEIAALPYDVVTKEEAREEIKNIPCPFCGLTVRKQNFLMRQTCTVRKSTKSRR